MKKPGPLTLAVIVALLPLFVVVAVYLYKLGSLDLSDKQADWGLFGDYVGGTLGALYALAAFLAVLYTAHVQREQSTVTQLQRLLDTSAETIIRILQARPLHGLAQHHEAARQQGVEFTVDWVLNAAVAMRPRGIHAEIDAVREDLRAQGIRSIGFELHLLNAELLHFTHCLSAFRNAGGSAAVERVYRTRYQTTVILLAELGHLNDVTGYYFDIENLRRQFHEARPQAG